MEGSHSLSERLAPHLLTVAGTLMPKTTETIVVHSSPDFEDGALSILEGLLRRGHHPVALLEQSLDPTSRQRLPRGVDAVHKNSLRGRLTYLRAGTVFTTHGPYRNHRPPRRQVVVNVWHGEALVKPVARGDGEGAVPSTWATSLSSVGRAFRAAEFGLHPQQVLIVGAPRNDRLVTADRDLARCRLLGADSERTVLAWLPTYRQRAAWRRSGRIDGATHTGVLPLRAEDVLRLDRWLAGKHVALLAKPHPTALHQRERFENIQVIDDSWLASRGLTTYQMLAATDILLTDASSVWVDFLLLDRPIVYVFPDLDEYQASRGLNLDPYESWIPGPLVRDADGLIEVLDALLQSRDEHHPERVMARERLHRFADGNSTERLLDALRL